MTKSKKKKINIKIIVIGIISAFVIGCVLTWGFLTNWGQGKKSEPVNSEPVNSEAVKYTVPVEIKDDIIEIENPESHGFKIGQIIEIGNNERRTIVGFKSGSLIIDRDLIDTYPKNTTIVVIKEQKKKDFTVDKCEIYNEDLTCQKCDDLHYLEDNKCKEYTYTSNKITCNSKNSVFTIGTETSDTKCVPCTTNQWFVNNECKNYTYKGFINDCNKADRKIFIDGTPTSDQKCIECTTDQWIENNECKDYTYNGNQTNCNNQRGVVISGTYTSDRKCVPCATTDWVIYNKCTTYKTCSENEWLKSSGTATSDRVCNEYTNTYTQTTCNSNGGLFIKKNQTSDTMCILCMDTQWVDQDKQNCNDIIPDLQTLKSLIDNSVWDGEYKGKKYGPIKTWRFDNSIKDLSKLFNGNTSFNEDISGWDVSNVTDMSYMFNFATIFNQPLDKWDVSNVTDMTYMFAGWGGNGETIFNQPLDNWDVSNVTSMFAMFTYAIKFNGNISNWNVSNVTDMGGMFRDAHNFNQDISTKIVTREDGSKYTAWDTSNVTSMSMMFYSAKAFDRDISNWNVNISNNNYIYHMFEYATKMNKNNCNKPIKLQNPKCLK